MCVYIRLIFWGLLPATAVTRPFLDMPPPSEAPRKVAPKSAKKHPAKSAKKQGFGGSSDSRASDAKCRCPGPLFGDLDLDPELDAPTPIAPIAQSSMSTLRPLDVDAPIAHASSSGLDPNATRLTSSVKRTTLNGRR